MSGRPWRRRTESRPAGGSKEDQASPGAQPGGARVKPANSKPGETTQETKAQPLSASAACQAPAGMRTCGCSPASISAPSRTVVTGPASPGAVRSASALPPWNSQSSVASTLCQCELCPSSSRNRIAVALARSPAAASARQVSRYQPPSGCGARPSAAIRAFASLRRRPRCRASTTPARDRRRRRSHGGRSRPAPHR
jgi:hypothetical protein